MIWAFFNLAIAAFNVAVYLANPEKNFLSGGAAVLSFGVFLALVIMERK